MSEFTKGVSTGLTSAYGIQEPKVSTRGEDPDLSAYRDEMKVKGTNRFPDENALIRHAMRRLEGQLHFNVTRDKNNFLPNQSLVEQGALPLPDQLSTLEEVSFNFMECSLTDDQFNEIKNLLTRNPGIVWLALKIPRCSCTESPIGLTKLYEGLKTLKNLQALSLDLNHSGFNSNNDTPINLSNLIPNFKNLRRFTLDVS